MSMMLPGGGFAPDPRGKSFGGQPTGIAGGGTGTQFQRPFSGGFGQPQTFPPMGGFGGKPPMGQPRGIDMDKRPGQPMQGGFGQPQQGSQQGGQSMDQQRLQKLLQLAQQGGQFGGQPMQGGFGQPQMDRTHQDFMNQHSQIAGVLGDIGGQFGGQPMSQMQQQLGQLTPQQMQLMSFPQPGQGGQFGGQPLQGGFNPQQLQQVGQPPMNPMQHAQQLAQRIGAQPPMNPMQNMQQQGSQQGQPMPQAPTTQQGQPPMPFKKGGFAVKPVWDKKRPKDLGKPEDLSVKKKKSAKARAKAAGRPYPNLIDNMAAARKKGK